MLTFNNMHDFEHYGNIVTYLRMKDLVPPVERAAKIARVHLLSRSTCDEMARNAWLSAVVFAEKMNVP